MDGIAATITSAAGIFAGTNVDDVSTAIAFSTPPSFTLAMHPAPGFAVIHRDELRLLLSALMGPGGGAQPMPDGRTPETGGCNRIQVCATVGWPRADPIAALLIAAVAITQSHGATWCGDTCCAVPIQNGAGCRTACWCCGEMGRCG